MAGRRRTVCRALLAARKQGAMSEPLLSRTTSPARRTASVTEKSFTTNRVANGGDPVSKRELDRFADVMIALAERVKAGEVEYFKSAPHLAPMRRLDETRAARQPKLRWKPEANAAAKRAAE